MRTTFKQFLGIRPRSSPRSLADNESQVAENCTLLSTTLKPLHTPSTVAGVTIPAGTLSIFPYNSRWLTWLTDVNVVRGPLAEDDYQRIYYSGDGKPKMRYIDGGTEYEYDLGLPAPTTIPTLTVQDKTGTTWTRQWHYHYEEPDYTVSQSGDLTEGVDVAETDTGTTYTVASIPAKTTASASAIFVLYFDAYSAGGTYLGRLWPTISAYANNTDFYLDGAQVTGAQVNGANAVLTLSYDTSRATDYEADRTYIYTYVTAVGEEGPPSTATALATVSPVENCLVSGLPASVSGNYNVTLLRLYRTVTATEGTQYRFIADIPIGTTSYLDEMTDADTGEECPSTLWLAPKEDLAGLCSMPGSFLAGFTGKTVWFSEPNQPHAWPEEYGLSVEHDIVAVAPSSAGLVVLTTGVQYLAVGDSPGAMTPVQIDTTQSCVAKRGVKTIGDMRRSVLYPSPDGMVVVDGTQAELVTETVYTREQWQALTPANFTAIVHDGRYYAFRGTSDTLIFDIGEAQQLFTTTTQGATAGYCGQEDDKMYIVEGTALKEWEGGTTYMTARWRTKDIVMARPYSFSVARVQAASYETEGVRLKLYANGTLVYSIVVRDDKAFRIKRLRDEKVWSAEVLTEHEVFDIMLSTSMRDVG